MRNVTQFSSDAAEAAMVAIALDWLDPNEDMGYFDPRNESAWCFLIAGDKPVIEDKTGFGLSDNKDHEIARGLQSRLTPAQFDQLEYVDRVIVRFWGAALVFSNPNGDYAVEWHETPKRAAAALQVHLRERYAAQSAEWRKERGLLEWAQ